MANSTNKLYRYHLLIDTIEKYENSKYVPSNLGFSWCCDTITWLWKWGKISEEEMESLCDRMVVIMNMY